MAGTESRRGELGLQLVEHMEQITWDRYGQLAVDNARRNMQYHDAGKSLAALVDQPLGEGDSAIVIAAGPSIRRHDPVKWIKETGYKGTVIATDSAISYCLRSGVVPHVAVTLDPHPTHVVRWFGDPHLTEAKVLADDYHRRQDMDEAFATEELKYNRRIIDMIDQYGSGIRMCLASSSSQSVVERVTTSGMQVHWWNPMLDDPDKPDSHSRAIYKMNRFPLVNAGGNVGSACWMMAHAVLGKKKVALTGMDFSYYAGTPYTSTQYYYDAVNLVGEQNLDQLFTYVKNPYTGEEFFSDPAYCWYKKCFLEMVQDADCKTYNCTGGGILFGDGIDFIPLQQFLTDIA